MHIRRKGNDTRNSKAVQEIKSQMPCRSVAPDHPAWGLTKSTIGQAAVTVEGRLRVIAETSFWNWCHIPSQTCHDCVHWEKSRCTLGIPEAVKDGPKCARLCPTFNPGEQ